MNFGPDWTKLGFKALLVLSVKDDGMIHHEGCTQDQAVRAEETIAPTIGFFAEPGAKVSNSLSKKMKYSIYTEIASTP